MRTNYRKVPWRKRNLRKIPEPIQAKIRGLRGRPITVGVTLSVPLSYLNKGYFDHLNISVMDGKLFVQSPNVIPPADMGRWSRINIEGHEQVCRDLPKITKIISVDTPNWGDWSRGSHTVDWPREVYQRRYIPPKEIALQIEALAWNPGKDAYVIRFRTEEILNPDEQHFEDDLLYNLNLLQENVGRVDVCPADATREDYLKTLGVCWEILPPGQREENLAIIIGPDRSLSPETREKLVERYTFLERLKPRNFVVGTSGFRRYFGAQFAADLVVFENVEYGNAAYVMGRNWEELSQLSRTELFALAQRDFVRVPHAGKWKSKLRAIIKERLSQAAA